MPHTTHSRFRHRTVTTAVLSALTIACAIRADEAITTPSPSIADTVSDVFIPVWTTMDPTSYVGQRMQINQDLRLKRIDIDRQLIQPYIKKSKSWSGEYVGKYLHSAVFAWQSSQDPGLRQMMDDTLTRLVAQQDPDGYLGVEPNKSGAWNVWCHKYALIGLLAHHHATGLPESLIAARKLGEYMVTQYGPDKTPITKGASHVGMSAISVMEPLVGLYRQTGDAGILALIAHVMAEADQRKMISGLLEHGSVFKICNNKAYEMLSCFVGFLELYRLQGRADLLVACERAWEDIISKRAYITGTASWNEHFTKDYELLAQDANRGMGEGCVSFSLLQFNWHLLRLTGKAGYGDELERIAYNAVLGAQSPRNGQLCYYMPLIGKKSYGSGPTLCCAYNLPRALAMIPACIAGTVAGQPTIILYTPFEGRFPVRRADGKTASVKVRMQTEYPSSGQAVVTVTPEEQEQFLLRLRVPQWCQNYQATIDGQVYKGIPGSFLEINRQWRPGDQVNIAMELPLRLLPGGEGKPLGILYPNQVAVQRGPQVLACDASVVSTTLPPEWIGRQIYPITTLHAGLEKQTIFVPYADAGQAGAEFQAIFDPFTIKE